MPVTHQAALLRAENSFRGVTECRIAGGTEHANLRYSGFLISPEGKIFFYCSRYCNYLPDGELANAQDCRQASLTAFSGSFNACRYIQLLSRHDLSEPVHDSVVHR